MDKGTPKAIRLQDYRPPAHLIDTVDLFFDLGEDVTTVRAQLGLRRNPARDDAAALPLTLDGQRLELVSVALNGQPLGDADYTVTPDHLTVHSVPETFTLETVVRIKPQENTALEGLYKSSGNFCTQCEAEGFRKITYFADRPDVMARYTTTITADKARYPVLLSNGNLIESGDLPDGRHRAVWEDPFPKPCYLFALVAGTLVHQEDRFRTASGRDVTLRIYVEPGNEDKVDHAMRSLIKSMRWDEEVFGLEYDLDIFNIVAVGDFNMGAMENKSLNVFNTKYILAKPETATDQDFLGIEAVVAHEYFHNWTGNRVTCRDWFQLSLKEGLTVFRDQEFSSDMNSRAVKRIADVQRLRTVQFPEDSGAMAHPVRPDSYVEINNFYTPTVYDKGSEVIRMYHTLLGPQGFRKGMDLYFQRHDGQAVTCDDFAAAMSDATGVDLTQFKRWYRQAGTPELDVTGAYDEAAKTYRLTVRQTVPPTPGQPVKEPMHIPLVMGLLGPDGADLPLRLAGEAEAAGTSRTLHITQAEQTFDFVDVPARPVPSLLRGFSAPVKLRADLTDGDLTFLMANDSDAFNRWEAGQTLATRLLLSLVADRQAGRELALPQSFIDAVGAILKEADQDPAFAAQALVLPTESYLGTQMEVIDPDAIHTVREFARRRLAEALRPGWLDTHRRNAGNEPFSVDAAAIGRRALKNLCLAYLMALEDEEALGLCLGQYRGAQAMTDVMAALQFLSNSNAPERDEAIAAFYERWKGEALVVDKWFSVQATSHRPDALERVTTLLAHPAFEIRNPNKVYALIGGFAGGNPVRFHDTSGAGYRFLADQVLRLDPMNPQVAARMVGPFSRLRRYDAPRRALMKAELERIVATPGLSPDVFEVASKSLEAAG
ncbi:aminopeptidase N (plasmid) [Azospirillum baldaniorum]|uniref:Aminopeptidase N n=1 Tax=Azospirillum baldaniorum TaxID=1064539 RepID=A0A9P1NND9_9PROT|nr:aminopeptidase N [Azospirillum baldaniorum]AWJ91368.1 aminopeptidase N [Azospirillum baldaniorum]TWA83780.1 aminopeptidase N [Azospirillum brasilense]CCC99641.1 aminopeptidase N [Azospirillum baldaniorum]